jgi:anti-sigma regulatory factor (Ser/Thr protein kinase)
MHHVELRPTPESARAARAFVAAHATVGEEALDVALLLTSEVVTNAILHACTDFVVGVTQGANVLMVTVRDGSTRDPVRRAPDHGRPSGRGLLLIEEQAREWGVHREDDGKTVWFTVTDEPASGDER